MEEFKVKAKEIKKQSRDLTDFEKTLKQYSADVEQIRRSLRWKIVCKEEIGNRLTTIIKMIDMENQHMNKLGDSLVAAMLLYEKSENQILGDNELSNREPKANVIDGDIVNIKLDKKNIRSFSGRDGKREGGPRGIHGIGSAKADQGSMKKNREKDKDFYEFVRSHERYKDYSDKDIKKLFNRINQEGCGYVAITNNIFMAYKGREEDFEKTFGFPMYDENGKPNYDYLVLDMYASTDDYFFIDNDLGKAALIQRMLNDLSEEEFRNEFGIEKKSIQDCIDSGLDVNEVLEPAMDKISKDYSENSYIERNTTAMNTAEIINRSQHYLNEKGVCIDYNFDQENLNPEQIKQYLDEGKHINIKATKFSVYDSNGKLKRLDGRSSYTDHWMTVIGVTEDGNYIVSSWGEYYYLKPSELTAEPVAYLVSEIK